MGTGSSQPYEGHVVIIGAGYAGVALGAELVKQGINLTIINPRDSMHHNVASVRAVAQPDFAKKTLIPLKPLFDARLKIGKVTDIQPEKKTVVLESGEEVTYSVLIIATGSLASFPCKLDEQTTEEALGQYEAFLQKVSRSKRILVIGGGATGTEIAAEIAVQFPEKEVSLLHAGKQLVASGLSEKFHKQLHAVLDRLNIKVILDDKSVEDISKIPEDGPVTVSTEKGSTIDADLVIKCVGTRANKEAYQNGLRHVMVEETGRLRVDHHFQVEGYEDIFAVGDCTNLPEGKLAFAAGEQAKHLASNLVLKFSGKQMKPYKPGNLPIKVVLCLGPNNGVGEIKNGWTLPNFLLVRLKSSEVLVPKYWKQLNLDPPA